MDDAREPHHPGGIDLLLTWLGIVGPRKARSKVGDRVNGTSDYFPRQLRSYLPAGANLSSCWINKQDFLHCISGGSSRICTRLAVEDCKLPQAARGDRATANRWLDRLSAFCQTRCRVDGDRAGPMARWHCLAVAPRYRCDFAGRAKWGQYRRDRNADGAPARVRAGGFARGFFPQLNAMPRSRRWTCCRRTLGTCRSAKRLWYQRRLWCRVGTSSTDRYANVDHAGS